MMSTDSKAMLGWLKAAGEESRLRLLALCTRQELSVSDLAEALRQSEPRVSRHLRILCEAGLLERLRQGQWVHYRVTREAAAAAFVQGVLGQVDRGDPVFGRDQQRAMARPAGVGVLAAGAGRGAAAGGGVSAGERDVAAGGSGAVVGAVGRAGAGGGAAARGAVERTFESRLGRALKGFVEAVDGAVGGSAAVPGGGANAGDAADRPRALVVGVEHLELLETAAAVAGECVAIAHSRRAAQSARAFAERRGIACRVLLGSGSNALSDKDIEAAGAPFDVVFLDHLAVPESALDGLLTYARRALAAGGRLWLFERYEALAHGSSGLEVSRDKVVEHPIGRLRRLLGDVGLTCERLSPIEADGEHVLAAVAVPARATLRGVGAA
jgi:DNA-binding transcriptional ArsR family regulator